MYLNYIIIPGVNAALFVYYTVNPNYDLKTEALESWIVFFSIICITRMTEIVLDDARIFLQTRKLQQANEQEPEPS